MPAGQIIDFLRGGFLCRVPLNVIKWAFAIDRKVTYLYKEDGPILSRKSSVLKTLRPDGLCVSKNAIPQIPPLLTISQDPPKFL